MFNNSTNLQRRRRRRQPKHKQQKTENFNILTLLSLGGNYCTDAAAAIISTCFSIVTASRMNTDEQVAGKGPGSFSYPSTICYSSIMVASHHNRGQRCQYTVRRRTNNGLPSFPASTATALRYLRPITKLHHGVEQAVHQNGVDNDTTVTITIIATNPH